MYMNLFYVTEIFGPKARLKEERESKVVGRKWIPFQIVEQRKGVKKVTLLGENSDDGIEREDVWILELVKDAKSNT